MTKINIIQSKFSVSIYLFILFASVCSLMSQADTTFLDTKGKDFWLTFLPNFHNEKYSSGINDYDSLFIFITSDLATNGKIEYTNLIGNKNSIDFDIPGPIKVFSFNISYKNYELLGFNDSGENLDIRNNCEVITKQYFHITSENEVTVFAHNQAHLTSEACIVYPTDVLGKDYFILSYNSDGTFNFMNAISTSSTPSQFVILATEDSTNLHISPKAPTKFNGLTEQNIYLNKGEAYLVQADITSNSLRTDLTGTEVHSDKPVAVFAGHQRATIPNLSESQNPSRDYLLEQMPPIEIWGKNAILFPFQLPSNATIERNDIFRILAGSDFTDIFINDSLITTLNKGDFYEGTLTNAFKVRANLPVLIAQFKKTSEFNYTGNSKIGDPFEILISPVEQFMKSYQVINPQTWIDDPVKVYTEHYISIIAEDSSISSVLLDGVIVPLDSFKAIPTSNYKFANISVSEGLHSISCNSKIGVYVYGYGEACSYGFCGGMAMNPINVAGVGESDNLNQQTISLETYPNPASENTRIKFNITVKGKVNLAIYDLFGIKELEILDEYKEPGIYEMNIETNKLENGVYYIVLSVNSVKLTKSILILR